MKELISSPSAEKKSGALSKSWQGSHSFIRNTSWYLAATYLSRIICALRGFLTAKWLMPEIYGFLGTVAFVTSFGFHLHLGSLEIMMKEVPGLLSLGQKDKARKAAQVTSSFYIAMTFLACAALWVYALRLPGSTPLYVRGGWMVAGIALLLEAAYYFHQTLARLEQRFSDISFSLLFANSISFVLTFLLIPRYGFYGFLVVAIGTPALGLLFLLKKIDMPWRLRWDWNQLYSMINRGFPILAMTVVFEAVWWIDRFIILKFVGAADFGYYMVGVMIAQICFLFPQVIASVIEPKVHFDYHASQDLPRLRENFCFPVKTMALLMPLGLALLDFFLPFFIEYALPAYRPGISTMRILIWGSMMMGFAVCTKPLVVALGKQTQVLLFYIVTIILNLSISLFLAAKGYGLPGVASGTFIASSFCGLGLLGYSFTKLQFSFLPRIKQIAMLYLPFLFMAIFSAIIPMWIKNNFHVSFWTLIGFRVSVLISYGAFVLFQIQIHMGLNRFVLNIFSRKNVLEEAAHAV